MANKDPLTFFNDAHDARVKGLQKAQLGKAIADSTNAANAYNYLIKTKSPMSPESVAGYQNKMAHPGELRKTLSAPPVYNDPTAGLPPLRIELPPTLKYASTGPIQHFGTAYSSGYTPDVPKTKPVSKRIPVIEPNTRPGTRYDPTTSVPSFYKKGGSVKSKKK